MTDSHNKNDTAVTEELRRLRSEVTRLKQVEAQYKRTTEALRESEYLHRTTLMSMSDAVFITDDAGAFTYICPNVGVIFAYSPEEVRELGNIRSLLGDAIFDPDELASSGEILNIERRIRDKSGTAHVILVNVKRVSVKGGTILHTCRDITERKRLEEEIVHVSETEHQRIGQDIHDGRG